LSLGGGLHREPNSFWEAMGMNKPLSFLISFGATLCALALSVEGYERFRIYHRASNGSWASATWDGPRSFTRAEDVGGPFPPDSDITQRDYAPDGSLTRSHTFHANNLGWVSRSNYSKAKSPTEFRIAVVGDSFVAGVTSATQWVDVTQRILSADTQLLSVLPARSITVLNLGLPGAGPQIMESFNASYAHSFQVDLTIVGFIYESLLKPPAPPDAISTELTLGDVHSSIYCRNPNTIVEDCIGWPLWNVPVGKSLTKSEVIAVRQTIDKLILDRRLLRPRPYLLDYLTSKPKADVSVVGQQPFEEEDSLALSSFKAIAKQSPMALFVLIPPPWYFDPATEPSGMNRFLLVAGKSGVHIVEGRTLLPKGSAEERQSWYIEGDGHFSDKGNEIYGRAIANLVHQKLIPSALAHVSP
jgi:hypothetical protein